MRRQPEELAGCRTLGGGLTDRRGLIKWGMIGAGGLTLPNLLRSTAVADSPAGSKRGNSVILLHMRGGPSQLETWDMKPEAPVEIRGELKPIPTNVPGIQICELLPRLISCRVTSHHPSSWKTSSGMPTHRLLAKLAGGGGGRGVICANDVFSRSGAPGEPSAASSSSNCSCSTRACCRAWSTDKMMAG